MEGRSSTIPVDHPVVIAFLVLAIVAFLSFAAPFLQPLALAILFSLALAPAARFLERRGMPRALAVVLTVGVGLGILTGLVLVVGSQLGALAGRAEELSRNIESHLRGMLQHRSDSILERFNDLGALVAERIQAGFEGGKAGTHEPTRVLVVEDTAFVERLEKSFGPLLGLVGGAAIVLVLVLFMLMQREDLSDRIVQLFGRRRIGLTTHAIDELGGRISRYLGMLAIVNASIGLIVGLGLWAIGVGFAVLWGSLAAVLRFIPYLGPSLAFLLPFLFAAGTSAGWVQPIAVVVLFAVVETAASAFVEPVVYGRTTGISALGLLVAALFWTWLWGPLGLLLSTPLTVCLAVLGKSVPALGAFWTLLGETAEMPPDVRYYQRVLSHDQDGAVELIEALARDRSRVKVFDEVLIPALRLAERDDVQGALSEPDRALLSWTTRELIEELEDHPPAGSAVPPRSQPAAPAPRCVLGIAGGTASDLPPLWMLARELAGSGVILKLATEGDSPLALADRIEAEAPDSLLISHLPPSGFTTARYLVKRLHARLPEVPILVGLWDEDPAAYRAAVRFLDAGARRVVHGVAEARDLLIHERAASQAIPPASPAAV